MGVKVYVVVALGLKEGDQVPETPLVETKGSGIVVPTQTGEIGLNVGVTLFGIGFMSTLTGVEVQLLALLVTV